MSNKISNKDNFSLGLGLFDFINPIFYTVTTITILKYMSHTMNRIVFIVYLLGAVLSIVFGLSIPTVKSLVGLGKMKFKMPVNLVFYVNTGIFISGLMLAFHSFKLKLACLLIIIFISLIILLSIYLKTKKFNTIAVLIGAIGYLLIYFSLIKIAIGMKNYVPIIFYSIAIVLFIFLIFIGIKANLKDARVHWVIEISNVFCQMFVAIGTLLLF